MVCHSLVNFIFLTYDKYLGIRCDEHGQPLPEGSPLPHRDADTGPNDWTPYASRAEFELCDLLYRRNQMPAGQIDDLLDIVAAMNAAAGGETPFTTHKDLYSTINATILGDAPWDHFNLNYQGETNKNSPSWQTEDFMVWFHNPLTVLHNLLSNRNFEEGFDYSPFQECDDNNHHRYENFMSRNWCWKQAVCWID